MSMRMRIFYIDYPADTDAETNIRNNPGMYN